MSQSAELNARYFEQIEDWLSEGKQLELLTASMLHRHVGGSYKQCVEALEAYLTTRPSTASIPKAPASVQQVLNTALDKVWRELWTIKQQELDAIKESFERDKKRMQTLTDERLELIDRLEQQVQDKDRDISQLKEQVAEYKSETGHKQKELEQIKSEFQQDRNMMQLLVDKRQDKITQLEAQLEQLRQDYDVLESKQKTQADQIRAEQALTIKGYQADMTAQALQIKTLTESMGSKEQHLSELMSKLEDERRQSGLLRVEQNARIKELEQENKALSLQVVEGFSQTQSVKVEQGVEIKQLELVVADHAARNLELEHKINRLEEQLSSLKSEVAIKDDALKAEKVHRQWALELSNEQTREITKLEQQNAVRERELLRITTLYERSEAKIAELKEEVNALIQHAQLS